MSKGLPVIIVNLKTYSEGYGRSGLEICRAMDSLSKETGSNLVVAVSATDISTYSQAVDIPIFAQHVDGVGFGSNTGSILAEAVKEAGATGTLINHAECQIPWSEIERSLRRCREVGLTTVLCTADAQAIAKGAKYNPDMLAVEPPELIGGDISVSTAKPEVISDSVNIVNSVNSRIPVLCGAGVKNRSDVSKAISLGSQGILLASGVVKSTEPKKALKDLIRGL
ncbi:MAG: triose-phosphate isomerase [Candidatus Thermoplasmatota archaeon]|nr:triose-phosphate isomerase [Candidatus Thermoplasmatota archaeon]